MAFGNINNKDPTKIITKKLTINNCAGFKTALLKLMFCSENSLINVRIMANLTQLSLYKKVKC